jgi:hypothetical protein
LIITVRAGFQPKQAARQHFDCSWTEIIEQGSMNKDGVPYQRKTLYLFITIPMIGMYIAIAVFLWHVNIPFLLVYGLLFVLVAITQSYVCVYYQCPYIGRFAPCVGGFCLPSSQIARLLKNARRSEGIYNVAVSVALTAFIGIILLPVYFLYRESLAHLLAYVAIVGVYAVMFLGFICPVCGTRHVCPGGQTSEMIMEIIKPSAHS